MRPVVVQMGVTTDGCAATKRIRIEGDRAAGTKLLRVIIGSGVPD